MKWRIGHTAQLPYAIERAGNEREARESGSVGMSCRWVKFCVKVLEKKNFLFHFLKTLEVHL